MADTNEPINQVLQEHHTIRETVELKGGSISDFEALVALRQAYSGWSQCSPEEVLAKRQNLLDTLEVVEKGLRIHWDHEEKAVGPVFGETLMKAFLAEHNGIAVQLDNAKGVIAGEKLEGLAPEELLTKRTSIQEIINGLMQAIEEHSKHEDVLFLMIRKGREIG